MDSDHRRLSPTAPCSDRFVVRFSQSQIFTEYDDFTVYYLIWEFTINIVIELDNLCELFDDERMFTYENSVIWIAVVSLFLEYIVVFES